jgi:hypothetical protein
VRSDYRQQDVLPFLTGSTLLVLVGALFLVNALVLSLGFSVAPWAVPLAALLSGGFCWWGSRRFVPSHSRATFVGVGGSITVLSFVFLLISGAFFDLSWDGQSYHQVAVIELARGWNPLYDPPLPPVVPSVFDVSLPINHYPKGPWFCAASLFTLTNQIEQGKVFNLLLLAAAFFLSLSACADLDRSRPARAILLAAVAALNPVVISQSLTFYVDGQMASLLTCMGALMYRVARRPDGPGLLALSLCLVMMVNVKFTGLAYALIFGATFLVWMFLARKEEWKLTSLALVLAFFVGVGGAGYHPYLTNLQTYGHPLHPVFGSHQVDIISDQVPGTFHSLNRVEKLVTSLFSTSANIKAPDAPVLKWPFTFTWGELATLRSYPDTRVGGFGPLFSGALLLGWGILLIVLARRTPGARAAAGIVLIILCSILVNSEAWWARFAPQTWLLPLPAVVVVLANPTKKLLRVAGLALALLLLLNSLLVASLSLPFQRAISHDLRQQLAALSDQPETDPVAVYFEFKSARVRFQEWDISYQEYAHIKDLPCATPRPLVDGSASVCPPPPSGGFPPVLYLQK